jgi:tetratricopeptide (TPR) repeat protein
MRRTGDVRNTAMALCNLANVILDAQGDLDAARGHYDEARHLFDQLDNTVGVTHALRGLGLIAIAQERFADARRQCEESLELSRSVGDREGIAQALLALIDPYLAAGEVDRARTAVDEVLAFVEEVGHVALSGSALRRSAQVAEREGDLSRAGECYREALRLPGALAERPAVLLVLEGLARVDPDAVTCARLLGAASAARDAVGPKAWPNEVTAIADTSRRLADLLGEARFRAASTAGRALDVAAAVELALGAPAG